MSTLLLIDGHSQAYRAYFGMKTPLSTRDGELTAAVFGFTRKLFSVSGDVVRPGLYEIPFGETVRGVIEAAGGVVGGGEPGAVLLGGAAGRFLARPDLDLSSRVSLHRLGKRQPALIALLWIDQRPVLAAADMVVAVAENGERDARDALRLDQRHELRCRRRSDVEVAVCGQYNSIVSAVDKILFGNLVSQRDACSTCC